MYGLNKGSVAICMNCESSKTACANCDKYELYMEKLRDNFREEKED